MLRGEFIRADGLVIPNNITTVGIQRMLELALQDGTYDFYVGLCKGVFATDLQIEDLIEPTIGQYGYGRIQLNRNDTDWPTAGTLNDQPFLESKELLWAAAGGPFDESYTRMFIAFTESGTTGNVFCISGALPSEQLIDVDTPEADRKFKYRLYAR